MKKYEQKVINKENYKRIDDLNIYFSNQLFFSHKYTASTKLSDIRSDLRDETERYLFTYNNALPINKEKESEITLGEMLEQDKGESSKKKKEVKFIPEELNREVSYKEYTSNEDIINIKSETENLSLLLKRGSAELKENYSPDNSPKKKAKTELSFKKLSALETKNTCEKNIIRTLKRKSTLII